MSMRPSRRIGWAPVRLFLLIGLASGGWGCGPDGDGLPREPISGTVTFDGEPIKSGTIQFHPSSAAEGMAAGGMIVDGRFDVPRHEGPVPGVYKVQIYSLGDAEPEPLNEEEIAGDLRVAERKEMPGRAIPARYNARTELTAEVKADEPNTYEFHLEP